ncbi:SMI1/KNR4 family protein [Proteus sp. FME41]|uniref:SMI1/KNR4 family protein n=1 Tax=Proteus sp. FME41 TaxID=2742608 RepID=UPI001867BD13|nr:SMI1/KNR4 family protein [Proteus sp. FME41]
MNKDILIKLLNSYCTNISIDSKFLSGYTDNEIKKIERLYDIKVTGQLYDFLNCIGRCSGGFFGDDPLIFYREWFIRGHVLFQYGSREELYNLELWYILEQKPFFISIESETQYYFLLTCSDQPNLVYHYDENEDKVRALDKNFNEYLGHIISSYNESFIAPTPVCLSGDLLRL